MRKLFTTTMALFFIFANVLSSSAQPVLTQTASSKVVPSVSQVSALPTTKSDIGNQPQYSSTVNLPSLSASATAPDSLSQLVDLSDLIVIGTVTNVESKWSEDKSAIYTYATLAVNKTVKGEDTKEVVVRTLGGQVGETEMLVFVFLPPPQFKVGEKAFVFVKKDNKEIWCTLHSYTVDPLFNTISGTNIPAQSIATQIESYVESRIDTLRYFPNTGTPAASASAPVIISISPNRGAGGIGTRVTIVGTNFGPSQGAFCNVYFFMGPTSIDFVAADIISWSDTTIVAEIPRHASSGPVLVKRELDVSNQIDFTITFSYDMAKWDDLALPVNYYINYNGFASPVDTVAAIIWAFQAWEKVSDHHMDFKYAGADFTHTGGGESDNLNLISLGIPVAPYADAPALTTCWSNSGIVSECDIVFNSKYQWGIGEPDKGDIQNIATHEIGHFLVLDDLYGDSDAEKTMYGIASQGETKKRTLEADDRVGIQYIYPGSHPPQLPPTNDDATILGVMPGVVSPPGQSVIVSWQMQNIGTTTWGAGYKLKFFGGDQMGGPDEKDVPVTPPGGIVNFSLNLIAPLLPNDHIGSWELWSPVRQGFFGDEVRVVVTVQDPSQPPQPGDITLRCLDCPGVVTPGQTFRPTIRATIINGMLLESRGDMLLHTNEPYYTNMPHIGVVGNHYAGSYYDFQFYADRPLVAPTSEGTYESKWRIWREGNWAGGELTIRFDVRVGGGTRPDPPTLTSPENWKKIMDGSTPQLCASAPSGMQYYFQLYQSQSDHDSGWVSSNCWTPPTLPWGDYKWHAKVRSPSNNVESDWSDARYFDIISLDPICHGPYFEIGSPSSADRIGTYFCVEDTGGVSIYANTAPDGSANGEWQWISHPTPPLCSGNIPPLPGEWTENWDTLMQPDGTHLIRATCWHGSKGQSDYRELVIETSYTLGRRRPSWVQPINPTQNSWINNRTIVFRWNPEESQRVNSFNFYVSTNPDPTVNPIVSQTFDPSTRAYTYTFSQDYTNLYWRVQACNEIGCGPTGDGHFGIDLVKPSSFINTLPITIYDTIQTVAWSCSDNSSGCQRYTVQVRDDALGEWQDWRSNVTEVSGIFRGLPGHHYCFRARAIDNAANLEDWPADPDGDTCTLIDLDNQPQNWWNASYNFKRNLTVLNWDSRTLNTGFPAHLHFDTTTTPSAADIYNASTAAIKGDDVRVVYQNITEVSRFIQTFTADAIDIWFDVQADIGPNPSNSTDYQLYYGNASASNPPANAGNVFIPRRDSGVVASWYFSEWGGSTAADNSLNGHDATRVNGGQWVTTIYGPAIDLVKDSKQYLMVNDPSSLNLSQFTFEAFFWRDHSDVGALITKWRDGENDSSYMFGVWQRKLMLRLRSPSGQFFETPEDQQPSFNLEDNRWYHVAATYDGSKVRFYVNGEFKHEWDWANGVNASSKNVFLGVQQSQNGDPPYSLDGYFDGLLGGIRISNYARTSFPYASFALVTNAPELSAGSESQYESPSLQPDLAVLSLTTYPAPSSQGGGVIVQAVVKNQGTRATRNGSWTLLYADHVPGVGDLNGLSFWLGTPIQAGAVATLTTFVSNAASLGVMASSQAMAESDHTLYVQADATGVTKDSNRANNVSTGASVCLANADAYEPNDTITDAVSLDIGSTVQMNFHGTEDQDWVKFTAPSSVTYTIQTSGLGDAADTYLYLYDTDGITLLASNDDYDGNLASRIDWSAPVTSTYYLLVKHWNPNVGGCGTGYSLSVGPFSRISHIYLPIIFRNYDAQVVHADFSASPTTGAPPLTIQFTDLSSGPVSSWHWSFGDGGTSSARNPSHNYTSEGSYSVSLTVYGPKGSDTRIKTGYITVVRTPNYKINDDTGIANQTQPRIVADVSGNVYAVWTDERNGNKDVYFSWKSPSSNWNANTKASDDTGTAYQDYPDLAVDNLGGAYAVWNDGREDAYADTFFSYRPAGGSWTSNVRINDVTFASQAEPSIALDNTRSVYVAWRDWRATNDDVYFSMRPAGGQWITSTQVSDDSGNADQSRPRIAVDTSGNAYAVWHDKRNGNWDIYFSYRPANGTWGTNIKVNDDSGTTDQQLAFIAIDSAGNAYVVWEDGRNGDQDVYFSRRSAAGAWSANERVNDDTGTASQTAPQIAVDSSGNAHVVWQDDRLGSSHIFYAYHSSGGSWGTNTQVDSDGIWHSWPSVAVDGNGNMHVVWVDDRNGNQDIYYAVKLAGQEW